MRFWIVAFLVVLTSTVCANRPEFGDVVASPEMVATFERNQPNIVISDADHRRHWRVSTPFVVFGDQRFDLITGGSLGFFSSYERKEAQQVILLQAKHQGANTTLGCLMPGMSFETNHTNPESPLFAFNPMMTCNLQIHGYSKQLLSVELSLEVSSMQNDRVVVESDEKSAGVILRREDARHLLKTIVLSVDNSTVETFAYPHKLEIKIHWEKAVPDQSVNLQFHVFVVAATSKEIERDEWLLALFLTIAFLCVSIFIFIFTFIKHMVLKADANRKNHQRALLSSEFNRTNMLSLVSVEQLAAAQSTIIARQLEA